MIGLTSLDFYDVCERCKLSKSRINDMIRAGEFPRPFKLGLRKNGWLPSQIDRWIMLRSAGQEWSAESDIAHQ